MIYKKANSLEEALHLVDNYPQYFVFSGGSDIVVKMQHEEIEGLIDISTIKELKYIQKENETIKIGALTFINTILENKLIQNYLPLLEESCKSFASHQIRNIASLAGNIVNDSPVADLIPPLLVLQTKVTLLSIKGERIIALEELFNGYKSLTMEREIISSFIIPMHSIEWYYRKIGTRERLNITKLSLAIALHDNKFFISGASLNPYVVRFYHLEKLLTSKEFSDEDIKKSILKDTNPSEGSLSTIAYRKRVLFNMIKEALKGFTYD